MHVIGGGRRRCKCSSPTAARPSRRTRAAWKAVALRGGDRGVCIGKLKAFLACAEVATAQQQQQQQQA
eukprot:COSAG06_NODE_17916_length_914_cov_1.397546_1_plen_67_part_01